MPAMVLFPTPPLADETAMIFFTSLMLRFCGSPRCMRGICGGAPERGSPYDPRLVSQMMMTYSEAYQRVLMLQPPQCREQSRLHGRIAMVTNERRGSSATWDGRKVQTRQTRLPRFRSRNFLVGPQSYFTIPLTSQRTHIAMKKSKITGMNVTIQLAIMV